MSPNARLDVETPEERQDRLARLLATQDEPTTPSLPTPPRTFHVGPPSELLSRLQAFLPQMALANEQLVRQPTADIDIENVSEDQEQYVEMDLGLGVFNARLKEDGDATSSSDEDSFDDGSGRSAESSEDEDDEDDGVPSALKIGQSKTPKRKTGSALVEMLDDGVIVQANGRTDDQICATEK